MRTAITRVMIALIGVSVIASSIALNSGCVAPANERTVSDLVAKRDSLERVIRRYKLNLSITEDQCMRYAKIVSRDPSQSRFIVGWTARAFSWTKTRGDSL